MSDDVQEHLLKFLADWQQWAANPDSSSPLGIDYCPKVGLCLSTDQYVDALGLGNVFGWHMEVRLKGIFEEKGMCRSYPFGMGAYDSAEENEAMHLDPNRLAFVADYLKEMAGE